MRIGRAALLAASAFLAQSAVTFGQMPANEALLEVLVAAYPELLAGHDGTAIVFKDGMRMTFDDGKPDKDLATRLENPSLKDMFYAPYVTGKTPPPEVDIDPGRVRHELFFRKMYGDCRKGQTARPLVDVVWLPKKWGKSLKVTSVNGVAAALQKVSAELDALPETYDPYLFPPAGTFNCRPIAGTGRLSAHGSGIAIDIATRHAHYWRWHKPDGTGRYAWRNEIPMEIVEIFERHGFIWGGKWYHYDTMHFEYRPELIAAGRLQPK